MDSFWRQHYDWMNADQWACFEMLCDLFGGPQHVRGKVKESGPHGIYINCTNGHNKFATTAYATLTKAVVLAHDRMIRFGIEPSGPNMLRLVFHKRHVRQGAVYQCHPTLEDAVERIRGAQ